MVLLNDWLQLLLMLSSEHMLLKPFLCPAFPVDQGLKNVESILKSIHTNQNDLAWGDDQGTG